VLYSSTVTVIRALKPEVLHSARLKSLLISFLLVSDRLRLELVQLISLDQVNLMCAEQTYRDRLQAFQPPRLTLHLCKICISKPFQETQ
jgi:hypothetical protein